MYRSLVLSARLRFSLGDTPVPEPEGPSSGRSPSLRFGEAPQFAPGNRPFLGPRLGWTRRRAIVGTEPFAQLGEAPQFAPGNRPFLGPRLGCVRRGSPIGATRLVIREDK